jgi:6-phosphogluconolactonase
MRRVVVYPDAATVAKATAARLITAITDSIAIQERVDVVVTGGTVGIATLRAVAANDLSTSVDWSRVHVWWGDERFVATGDADRNEGQAQEALFDAIPLPEENIHRMASSTEVDSAGTAAALYHDELMRNGNPEFDILLLGLGPDGHVASLFPGHPAFADRAATVLAVADSPKPPPVRVTLSLVAINRAKQVWIVAAGPEKAEAVAACLGGDTAYPGAAVSGTDATLWLIDAAAAGDAASATHT